MNRQLPIAGAEERLPRARVAYFDEQVDAIMRTDSTWTFFALVDEAEALLPVALLVPDALDVPDGEA